MGTVAMFLLQMGPYRDHDMDWDGHWWMPTILLVVVVITIGLIAWVIVATSRTTRSESSANRPPSAKQMLDQRLAQGDISTEDYEARRKLLED